MQQHLQSMAFQVGLLSGAVTGIERRQERVEKDLAMLKGRFQRALILTGLWSVGTTMHLQSDRLGELLALFLKAALTLLIK